MDELQKLLKNLAEVEEDIILDASKSLDDEEKALLLFLFLKSREPDFTINFRDYVNEGIGGFRQIRNEFVKSLSKLDPSINHIRDWGGSGKINKEVAKNLKKYKLTEINGLLDKSQEVISNSIALLLAFNLTITKKTLSNIIKKSHMIKYGQVFTDPKVYSNGNIYANKKYGVYEVRPGLGGLIIATSRKFCKANAGKIRLMRVWKKIVDSFPTRPGGFNCRHIIIPLSKGKRKELLNSME